jgi:flavin reductase (DIM6/NTAB) family NADH-FMN oxidoreductase RutF
MFQDLVASIDYPMFIVTTSARGSRAGCLVGFVTQASLKPGRLLVCLSKANYTFGVAQSADVLVVHFLGREDLALARLFGEETGDNVDKFERCDWESGLDGAPVLTQCKGWVVATILDRVDCGDHMAFLVEPVNAEANRPEEAQLSFRQVRDLDPGHPA